MWTPGYGVPHSIIATIAKQVIHRSDTAAPPSPKIKRAQPAKTALLTSGNRPHNKPCNRQYRSLTGNGVWLSHDANQASRLRAMRSWQEIGFASRIVVFRATTSAKQIRVQDGRLPVTRVRSKLYQVAAAEVCYEPSISLAAACFLRGKPSMRPGLS